MNTTQTKLETHIINPNQTPTGSIIWMHGLGANNRDFDPLIPILTNQGALPLRFVFPNAPVRPVTINQNMAMPAWYDVYSLTNLNKEDVKGIAASRALIMDLIQDEIANGTPANRIILAGFSQGGAMALHTGLQYPEKIAGILGLSCYLPLMDQHENLAHIANKNTPVLMIHGTQDMTLPIFAGKMGHDIITKTHANTDWKTYNMQHEITPAVAQDVRAWFETVLK